MANPLSAAIAARIAYLTSDVVLSVQPALQTDSLFSKSLKALKASKATGILSKGTPEVRAAWMVNAGRIYS